MESCQPFVELPVAPFVASLTYNCQLPLGLPATGGVGGLALSCVWTQPVKKPQASSPRKQDSRKYVQGFEVNGIADFSDVFGDWFITR
jgi:hypothetical protein